MTADPPGGAAAEGGPGFSFALDPFRGLLRITFTGQWTALTVATYRLARARALREAALKGIGPDRLLLLLDRRGQGAQSQEVVAAIADVVADNGRIARRTAVVVESALHTRQIRRTAPSPTMGIFEREDDAVAWLGGD